MTDESGVSYEVKGKAAWLVLDRPKRRNALSPEMVEGLLRALGAAQSDAAVRAIVLTGRGPSFCAGADLKQAASLGAQDEGAQESLHPFAELLRALDQSPVPTVAAVNGSAYGGGLGLMAACDVVIASAGATFSFSEVRVGLIPAMISVFVVPRIGLHQARRLFLSGRKFSAEEGVDIGLVHRCVPPGEWEAAVADEVADISLGGPQALASCKRLLQEVSGLPTEQALSVAARLLAERVASAEGQEGVRAFSEKRPPSWTE